MSAENPHNITSEIKPELHPKLGVSGILSRNGKILLGRRRMDDTQPGMWCTPGGGVEFRETYIGALIREFKEEVLLDVNVCTRFLVLRERIKDDRHVVMIFMEVVARHDTSGIRAHIGDGFDSVGWFSPQEVGGLRAHGLITDMTYDAVMLYLQFLRDSK